MRFAHDEQQNGRTRQHHRRRQVKQMVMIAGVAVVATAAWPCNASAADPKWLDTAIARLDDDSFAIREAAAEEITTEETLTIDEIGERLGRDDLTAEQRLRLDRAGLVRFAALPRAGLGVRFAAANGFEGVPLESVLENFPASTVLRAGDVVLSIDDQPVGNSAQMGSLILSRQPGETLRMEVERTPPIGEVPGGIAEAKRLMIDVPLGRYEDLATGVNLTPTRLEAAYRQFQLRRGFFKAVEQVDAVVGGKLAPIEWLRAEGYDHTAPASMSSKFENISAWRYFSFAGQPASWISAIDLRRGDSNAMNRRAMVGLQANGLYDRVEEALAGYRAMLIRVIEIDGQLEAMAQLTGTQIDPQRVTRIQAERKTMVEGLEELAEELSEGPVPALSGVSETAIDELP